MSLLILKISGWTVRRVKNTQTFPQWYWQNSMKNHRKINCFEWNTKIERNLTNITDFFFICQMHERFTSIVVKRILWNMYSILGRIARSQAQLLCVCIIFQSIARFYYFIVYYINQQSVSPCHYFYGISFNSINAKKNTHPHCITLQIPTYTNTYLFDIIWYINRFSLRQSVRNGAEQRFLEMSFLRSINSTVDLILLVFIPVIIVLSVLSSLSHIFFPKLSQNAFFLPLIFLLLFSFVFIFCVLGSFCYLFAWIFLLSKIYLSSSRNEACEMVVIKFINIDSC